MQRVIKRFKEGAEDGIYAYGAVAIREMGPGDYWKKIKQTVDARNVSKVRAKKPWWKFW